ncbi:MAG: IS30 family transposase [Dehalococcoidia bacterium]|jgi:IS30 family transposase|nr:IS30 family transposase [Dehalococcoidia bacterium]
MRRGGLSQREQADIWRRYGIGESLRSISRSLGRDMGLLRRLIASTGGRQPRELRRSELRLSLSEREEISRGLVAGESCRSIARQLGRAPSTVSREIFRNGGRGRYRACEAERIAFTRARRPKSTKLGSFPQLRHAVEALLKLRWSPQQIAGWLARVSLGDREFRVSHETIYLALFVQPRATLHKQLTRHLRSRRKVRSPRTPHVVNGQGQLRNAVHISERPAEAEDRAVPGHWEGDLMLGTGNSAIATLVERCSRFTVLVRLPNGRTSEAVFEALKERIATLPQPLVRSLTWDRGTEMARHAEFTRETGLQLYFCDPRSPWQRGSNENTNGLLRQYYPKGTSLAAVTQQQLDAVAEELNDRPRQTLGFRSPSELFDAAVALTT